MVLELCADPAAVHIYTNTGRLFVSTSAAHADGFKESVARFRAPSYSQVPCACTRACVLVPVRSGGEEQKLRMSCGVQARGGFTAALLQSV